MTPLTSRLLHEYAVSRVTCGPESHSEFTRKDYQALVLHINQLEADAARYRWLRDSDWKGTDLESIIRLQLNTLWDAKIDAAISAEGVQL